MRFFWLQEKSEGKRWTVGQYQERDLSKYPWEIMACDEVFSEAEILDKFTIGPELKRPTDTP